LTPNSRAACSRSCAPFFSNPSPIDGWRRLMEV
jgi:hypothetical protein